MNPRIADLLLDLEFADPEPLPTIPLDVIAIPIQATTAGKVYGLEIADDDPILDLLKLPDQE